MNYQKASLGVGFAVFVALGAACARADDGTTNAPSVERALGMHNDVVAEFSYTGPSELRDTHGTFGNLDTLQYRVAYSIGLRSSETWEWRTGLAYNQFSFGVPSGAPLPNSLYGIGVPLGFNWRFREQWELRFNIQPGVYSDFKDITGDDVFVPITLGVTYTLNTNLLFVGGFSIEYRRDVPVLPYLGARWRLADHWTLSLLFPRPGIEFQPNQRLALFAGAGLRGGAAQVNEHFGTDVGRPELNNTTLTYWEFRGGAGLRYRLIRGLTAELDGGWTFERRFVFREPDVTLKTKGAPYVQVSLNTRF